MCGAQSNNGPDVSEYAEQCESTVDLTQRDLPLFPVGRKGYLAGTYAYT